MPPPGRAPKKKKPRPKSGRSFLQEILYQIVYRFVKNKITKKFKKKIGWPTSRFAKERDKKNGQTGARGGSRTRRGC